ncbi:helix-turn-helix domain-containing protein [Tunicatimonas pelagia]|uniref:helix-turn-helix domain-containing protein n=1 Tax=Tunicatimonas pelagia TaxID=931531 RepID=UPI00266526D1|nr:helix-turn-helix domain-containing protein [Tunicatimonas pelagia]WKN40919.1 helix-turn-helix domain-containing protein [Tunicatimonas pelagia]
MVYSYQEKDVGAFFALSTDYTNEREQFQHQPSLISIHWNKGAQPVSLNVDGIDFQLQPHEITTTTFLQHLDFPHSSSHLATFTFNREFYCINDHDHETSCNGVIFFGNQQPPITTISQEEQKKFDMLYDVFLEECRTQDTIQGEMLRILLKRLIIKITRLTKDQSPYPDLPEGQRDTIRKFNVLVDIHYKEKRSVQDYADLLFRSPKTLSNLFAKYQQKSPLQIIHERIVLEAKRQLLYTSKSTKEIAHELGFNDVGSLHRLFKRVVGQTPQQFKSTQN